MVIGRRGDVHGGSHVMDRHYSMRLPYGMVQIVTDTGTCSVVNVYEVPV